MAGGVFFWWNGWSGGCGKYFDDGGEEIIIFYLYWVEDLKFVKHELQNIISGKSNSSQSNLIKTAQAYLGNSKKTSNKAEAAKPDRADEERALKDYAFNNQLIITKDSIGNFITEGAEQKVFYKEGDTAYTIIGFIIENETLCAVVSQPFVFYTSTTNLEDVKRYLLANGFLHKKNNDYYHPYLGIILEDLHDENVLTNNGILFFVDTVFYLTEEFYK